MPLTIVNMFKSVHFQNWKCDCIKYLKLGDPACGTAGFLVAAADFIREHYEDTMTQEQCGYMEDITQLQKPPFDKPVSFIKLFDAKRRMEIMHTIKEITENATKTVGWGIWECIIKEGNKRNPVYSD